MMHKYDKDKFVNCIKVYMTPKQTSLVKMVVYL